MPKTDIIAEMGCIAQGDLATMQRLIQAAADAGCAGVKNQYISQPDQVRARRRSAYQSYEWLCYPLDWHAVCRDACHALGMAYGCSTNLAEDVAAVSPYVDFHKRPSFEHEDTEWLSAAKATGQRVILSTGMLDHDALEALLERVHVWADVLQCTSMYPEPLDAVHLRVIDWYDLDGLSDHTRHVLTGAVAVGAGARILEAHLRLMDTPESNPDYATAFTPSQFGAYVRHVREAEQMMGEPRKAVQVCEAEMVRYRVQP